jgi:hypothetical protein
MTDDDRLDRVEAILNQIAERHAKAAARERHDQSVERSLAELKEIRKTITVINQAITTDAQNIRALLRIAEGG